jgi:hypothetical protein
MPSLWGYLCFLVPKQSQESFQNPSLDYFHHQLCSAEHVHRKLKSRKPVYVKIDNLKYHVDIFHFFFAQGGSKNIIMQKESRCKPLSMKISVNVPSAYSLSSCLLSVPFVSLSSARNISAQA